MQNRKILVTGGAGYIGSHVVRQLGEAGESVVTLDNLTTGFEAAVTSGEFVLGDTGDADLLEKLFLEHGFDTVLHFAAHTIVPESVEDPLKYYRNNTASSRTFARRVSPARCQERRVFHQRRQCTVCLPTGKASEETADAANKPLRHVEVDDRMDVARSRRCRWSVLRCHYDIFNVAGCSPTGEIGQSTPKATLLVKVACEAAVGKRPHISVFGSDYPTPDGTGLRDYIHVEDLATAHL